MPELPRSSSTIAAIGAGRDGGGSGGCMVVSSWILEQKKASITRHPTSCTMEKLQLFPSGGTGRHGGNCHLEELPNIGSSQELLKTPFECNTVINVLLVKQNKSEAWNLNLLNVTGMTVLRRDGHLSLYYLYAQGWTSSSPPPRLQPLVSLIDGTCFYCTADFGARVTDFGDDVSAKENKSMPVIAGSCSYIAL
ncbi:hypothetical protein H5410_015672, partial [Solanum commersonii]